MRDIFHLLARYLGKLLERFPVFHSGVKAGYTEYLLRKPPVMTPFGFNFLGTVEMQRGSFEADEAAHVLSMIRNYDVMVNVGANTGYYVCLARSQGVRVVAIEPDERNLKLLMRNCEINGWLDVEVLPVAAGAVAALLPIYGGGTAASLVQGWAGATVAKNLVPVNTLVNLLGGRIAGRRVLMLVDVEGFELEVLKGAGGVLAMNSAVDWMVEICIDEHQPEGRRINPYLQETFQVFWDHGYEARWVADSASVVEKADVVLWSKGQNLPTTHNFFFSKPKNL